jgi:hypothetical protein
VSTHYQIFVAGKLPIERLGVVHELGIDKRSEESGEVDDRVE